MFFLGQTALMIMSHRSKLALRVLGFNTDDFVYGHSRKDTTVLRGRTSVPVSRIMALTHDGRDSLRVTSCGHRWLDSSDPVSAA